MLILCVVCSACATLPSKVWGCMKGLLRRAHGLLRKSSSSKYSCVLCYWSTCCGTGLQLHRPSLGRGEQNGGQKWWRERGSLAKNKYHRRTIAVGEGYKREERESAERERERERERVQKEGEWRLSSAYRQCIFFCLALLFLHCKCWVSVISLRRPAVQYVSTVPPCVADASSLSHHIHHSPTSMLHVHTGAVLRSGHRGQTGFPSPARTGACIHK